MTRTFAVVGASLAGGTAAAVLRTEGFDGRVVLVGEEPHPPYERPPLSKEYLRAEVPFERSLVRPRGFWEENGIETRFGVRAVRIDTGARVVSLSDGDRVHYDAVLVATGGRNRRPPIPGLDLEGVHGLRTLDDADRLRAAIAPGRKAVVVGMGFIGCEVAASLRQSGIQVTAIEPLPVPLHRAVGEEVGRVVEAIHRDQGVELLLGEGVAAFEGDGRVEAVRTTGGRVVGCDLAVVGLGIEPATGVVTGTPVEVGDGIVVDVLCRTNIPGVFAAGDVAYHHHPVPGRHLRVEHWQNALKQGQAAALSMLGKGAPYDEVHWFWSDQYGHTLQYAGFHDGWDEIVVRGSLEERSFLAFYLKGGLVVAAAALDRGRELRRSIALVKARAAVEPEKLRDPEVDVRALAAAAGSR